MYLQTKCEIHIGSYKFTRCHSIEIEKGNSQLAATAIIIVPLTAVLKSKDSVTTVETAKVIQPGMKVTIILGYKDVYEGIEFKGYVKKLNYKQNLEIECENGTYLLRRVSLSKVWNREVKLKELLNYLVAETEVNIEGTIPDIALNKYSMKNNAAFELQKIKDELPVGIEITDDDILMVYGLDYINRTGEVTLALTGDNCNVIDAGDLKYHRKEDVIIKIKAVNVNADNSKTEVSVGDEGGELKTLHFYNIKDQSTLEAKAKQELDKLKFDGYSGKLTTFLVPVIKPGMTAKLKDPKFNDREGNYYIDNVKTTFNDGGSRRESEIGIKLN